MNILIITPDIFPYSKGYGGRITLMLCEGFKRLGHEVNIISSIPDNITPDIPTGQYNIKLMKLYKISRSTYSYFMPLHIRDFLSLRNFLNQNIHKYDLIVINDFTWSLVLASLLFIRNKNKNKVMMINHGILSLRANKIVFYMSKIFNKIIANIFLSNIRCIISFSSKSDADFQQIVKSNAKRTVVPSCLEYNSVTKTYENSLSFSRNVLDKYKKYFNINDFIFSVSEINFHKGYHILLEACGILFNHGYNFDVVIAGKENIDYMVTLNEIISKYNMEKNVHFIGQIDDIEKFVLMMKSNLYVIPSLNEGFGVGAQEASILGVKTVATDTGAHKELLGNKNYNIIVKPGDVTDLKQAIIAALNSDKVFVKLDLKRLDEFSCDKISERILRFFSS